MRVPQAKSRINRKTSSRGKKKIVDPRQQLIKKFFQVKDAEEREKLESSDLEADNAGMGGAAAGVSPADSDAGLSGESEKELSEKQLKDL